MKEYTFLARASFGGYVVLAGPWFALGCFNVWLIVLRPSPPLFFVLASVLCFTLGLIAVVWLRGFAVSITGDSFTYRDGMYKTLRGSVAHIKQVKGAWIGWEMLWRRMQIPRLLVEFEDGTKIIINSKPFGRANLREFLGKVDPKSTKDEESRIHSS